MAEPLAISAGTAMIAAIDTSPDDQTAFITGDETSHVRLPVAVNGLAAMGILDTGCSTSVVSRSFAEHHGLVRQASFRSIGVCGEIAGEFIEDLVLKLMDRCFILRAAMVDLSCLASAARAPVDIVIGQDILRQTAVDVDFPSGKIKFLDAEELKALEESLGQAQQLIASPDHFLAVPLSLEQRPAILGVIDLGSNIPLYVSPTHAADIDLLADKTVATSASAGAEGIELSWLATLSSIELAGAVLNHVPVQVPGRWMPHCEAILGLPVLRRFRMVLDVARLRIWLKPCPSTLAPFRKDRSGLGVVPAGDRLRVIHVSAGSPAAQAGLSPADEIIRINGHAIDKAYLQSGVREGRKPAGTVLRLLLANGQEKKIILNDYY
ncbi:aspartyl protease family protein [Sphingopyxis chilensis]